MLKPQDPLRNEKCSKKLLTLCGKLDNTNIKNVTKKALKKECQLKFELVNKVLLHHTEKRTTVTSPDLFFMEALSKYQKVNFSAIVIEHMNTVMTTNNGKHGLSYGFL